MPRVARPRRADGLQSPRHVSVARATSLVASCLLPAILQAAPLLRCQIEQGAVTKVLDTAPVDDPYSVAAVDINGRFRFKAVVMGDAQHVDYVKLYVYATTKRQPRLLHQANFREPATSREAQPMMLTGVNYVYSPQLEREIKYSCTLLENPP